MNTRQNNPAATAAEDASRLSPTLASSSPLSSSSPQPAAEQASGILDSAIDTSRKAYDSVVESGRQAFDSAVETSRQALDSSKKWIEDAHLRETVDQTTQSVKDFGSRAAARINGLSTTQKVVGGALVAAGLGWLALRKVKSASASADDSSAPSVYGRSGSFARAPKGYQVPDASRRRPASTERPSSFGTESAS